MTDARDRGRAGHARQDREERPAGRRRASGGMQAARRAAQQVRDLTGHEPENVISVAKEDGGWQVGVEVLELHRVPETTDILAVYEVSLDTAGDLVRCRRGPRYHRASTQEGT
jgi:gas vesicle protein GvpO